LQRGPYIVLHLAVRRRVSVRAVSSAVRQCPAAAISRHLAGFAATRGGPLHSRQAPADMLFLCAPGKLHALPGPGLYGREYARAFHGGLRKILCAHGNRHRRHARQQGCRGASTRLGADKPRAIAQRLTSPEPFEKRNSKFEKRKTCAPPWDEKPDRRKVPRVGRHGLHCARHPGAGGHSGPLLREREAGRTPARGVTLPRRHPRQGGACDMVMCDAALPRGADVPAYVH